MSSPIPPHQMAPPTSDDFLNGKSVKSFSFDVEPPARLGGPITELPPVIQKRDFDDNTPQFWPDGRPKWVMPVYVQTDLREDADDDGVRAHYLEYKKANAVKAALKAAGRDRLEVGGTLWLTYLSPKPAKGQAKNYTAEYTPPPPGFVDPNAPDPWANMAPQETPPPAQQWGGPPAPQVSQVAPPQAAWGSQQAPAPTPPQQQWTPPPAAAAPPLDPSLVAFLASHNVDSAGMTVEQATMIARTFV